MKQKISKETCLLLLQQKAAQCAEFPKKSDFDEETVSMIKSYFGPWPRALEAAGIKPINTERIERRRARRLRTKENKIRYKKVHQKGK